MINVRRGVFETNSSSTHCLTLNNEVKYEIHEELFTKDYVIKQWNEKNRPPFSMYGKCDLELTSIEDKLTYFLTMYYQANSSDYMGWGQDNGSAFLKRLQALFPNTVFALKCDEESSYILEDGEWLYDEEELPVLNNMTDYQLKAFMEYGVIYFGDRDYELYADFLDYELNKKHILMKFSG